MRRLAASIFTLLVLAPAAPAQSPGPDYMSSDNVEVVGRLKETGDVAGGAVVGNTLFVTSSTHLSIYDVTDAEAPALQGVFTVDIEWENEEVPTNGKILGISGSIGCVPLLSPTDSSANCLNIYDVSDPANVKFLSSVPGAGDHTQACVLDCTWFWGSEGTIVDARDPKNPVIAGNWIQELDEGGSGCHHVREVAPGYMLGSCQPISLLSVRPEDGGSPTKPVLLALGHNEDGRFIHSSRWPNKGTDKFMLAGGETFVKPTCDDASAAFMTWDATNVLGAGGGFTKGSTFTMLDESRPTAGTYTDGRNPYFVFGCSVHWFQEHPTFRDGGLVAVAEFENGTRLKQVQPDGKIVEQGFLLPLVGVAGAPHWHPNGKVFYSTDYERGVDIVRYTGDTYVPAGGQVTPTPGATPGTGGAQPPGTREGVGRVKVTVRAKRVPGARGRKRKLSLVIADPGGVRARLKVTRRAGRAATVKVTGKARAGAYRWQLRAGKRVVSKGSFRVVARKGMTIPGGRVMTVRAR